MLAAKLRLQLREVLQRIEETIGMVDPETTNSALAQEAKCKFVHGRKHIRSLDADSSQIVNVEEPPVVDLVDCYPPVGKAVVLCVQQPFQAVKAAMVPRAATDFFECA